MLNFKKVVIKVTGNEIKKDGFFSSSYAQYSLEADIPGLSKQKVFRKDQDFYNLRKILRN